VPKADILIQFAKTLPYSRLSENVRIASGVEGLETQYSRATEW